MTIEMPDSIRPADLPPGYRAYLGYTDGRWPTAPVLRGLHPSAHVVGLTVTGNTLDADGCDIENGDLSPWSGARWAKEKLHADPQSRPVQYASVGIMATVVSADEAIGVSRSQVRLLTAHYGKGRHICGPGTCGELPFDADGTQWTDSYAGANGSKIDMSELKDSFFGATAAPPPVPGSNWEDRLMATIATVRKGDSGQAVRNWQALLEAAGYSLAPYGFDGKFGPLTDQRTRKFQEDRHITVDGIAGPQTWTTALSA